MGLRYLYRHHPASVDDTESADTVSLPPCQELPNVPHALKCQLHEGEFQRPYSSALADGSEWPETQIIYLILYI